MSKPLRIVDTVEHAMVEELANGCDEIVVASSPRALVVLKQRKVSALFVEEIVPDEIYYFDQSFVEIAKGWRRISAFEYIWSEIGINLFSVIDLELSILFNNIYCDVCAGKWLVNRFKPSSLICEPVMIGNSAFALSQEEYYVSHGAILKAREDNIPVEIIARVKRQENTDTNKKQNILMQNLRRKINNVFWDMHSWIFRPKGRVFVHESLYGLEDMVLNLIKSGERVACFGGGLRMPKASSFLLKQTFLRLNGKELSDTNAAILGNIAKRSMELWPDKKTEKQLEGKLKVKGVDLFPLFKKRINSLLHSFVVQITRRYLLYKEFIEEFKPKTIIVNSYALGDGKLICLSAKGNSVTIAIQHGYMNDGFMVGNFGEVPVLADYIVLTGNHAKDVYLKLSPSDSQKLLPIGIPRWDVYYGSDVTGETGTRLRMRLDLPKEAGFFLFTTQAYADRYRVCGRHYMRHEEKAVRESLARLIMLFPRYYLVVKARSDKEYSEWKDTCCKHGISARVRVVCNCDISSLIKAAKLVITGWSTTGFEAIICGKPLVVINYRNCADFTDYTEGGALRATSFKELVECINQILCADEGFKEMLQMKRHQYLLSRYSGPGATDNLIKFIKKLHTAYNKYA